MLIFILISSSIPAEYFGQGPSCAGTSLASHSTSITSMNLPSVRIEGCTPPSDSSLEGDLDQCESSSLWLIDQSSVVSHRNLGINNCCKHINENFPSLYFCKILNIILLWRNFLELKLVVRIFIWPLFHIWGFDWYFKGWVTWLQNQLLIYLKHSFDQNFFNYKEINPSQNHLETFHLHLQILILSTYNF